MNFDKETAKSVAGDIIKGFVKAAASVAEAHAESLSEEKFNQKVREKKKEQVKDYTERADKICTWLEEEGDLFINERSKINRLRRMAEDVEWGIL
jgi:hypothetical protein